PGLHELPRHQRQSRRHHRSRGDRRARRALPGGTNPMKTRLATLLLAAFIAAPSFAQTLRIGLAEDPDVLDPTLARTFVCRIVFAAVCNKPFDLDEKLNIVPKLATSYQWSPDYKTLTLKIRQGVTFHDGEKLDAAAVKYSLERHKTMAGSNRRGEL